MRDVKSAMYAMSLYVVITDVLGTSFVKDSARSTVLIQPSTGVEEDIQTDVYRKNICYTVADPRMTREHKYSYIT